MMPYLRLNRYICNRCAAREFFAGEVAFCHPPVKEDRFVFCGAVGDDGVSGSGIGFSGSIVLIDLVWCLMVFNCLRFLMGVN